MAYHVAQPKHVAQYTSELSLILNHADIKHATSWNSCYCIITMMKLCRPLFANLGGCKVFGTPPQQPRNAYKAEKASLGTLQLSWFTNFMARKLYQARTWM